MRERLGIAVGALGVALLLIGLASLATRDDGTDTATPPTSVATSTSVASTTTTSSSSTTSSSASTTTTTATTVVPAETVDGFLDAFAAAIAAGDTDFLYSRLHPVVLAQPNADTCRGFIEREILALVDYHATGEPTGPTEETVADTTVPDVYRVPISFQFQGESFESTAMLAPVDGEMHWFAECR